MPREDTQFKKGEVANPNGRPKGSGLNLTSLLKSKLKEIPEGKKETYSELFIKTLLHKALVKKDLQSLKLIMNYVDGLPKQNITVDGALTVSTLLNNLKEDGETNTRTKGDGEKTT